MNVLIVKLTSMGDLVQALPALSDAARACPGIRFDWVVDEAFAEVPQWHPAVRRVIRTAHRRWRRSPGVLGGELAGFLKALRANRYEAVIDAQTNLKSALVTLLARGVKHGPDRASVREKPAHWAYHHHHAIPQGQLAIDRWRQLFSRVLDYPLPAAAADFGLAGRHWPTPEGIAVDSPYLVFVTNASWDNKYWIEAHWRTLIRRAGAAGYRVLLTWGSERERSRTCALAAGLDNALVLPRMGLSQLAGLMLASDGAICMDTGLAHVAAALDVPTVTLYGPTDPALIGATGARSVHVVADGFPCIPCYRRDCEVPGYRGPEAQCLKAMGPERVWDDFCRLAAVPATI
jgi:heptosyltransferase-1